MNRLILLTYLLSFLLYRSATRTEPVCIVVDADEGRNDREVVDDRIQFDPRQQTISRRHQLHNRTTGNS